MSDEQNRQRPDGSDMAPKRFSFLPMVIWE